MSFFPQTFKHLQSPNSQIESSFGEKSCVKTLRVEICSYFTFLRKFETTLGQTSDFSQQILENFHLLDQSFIAISSLARDFWLKTCFKFFTEISVDFFL